MVSRTARDEELSGRRRIRDKLVKLFNEVDRGFADQRERSDRIMDYWDAYNCKLGEKQFYSGNSKLFVPIIRNAVKARRTRFVNQLFPQSGRYVEVVTDEQDPPHALIALLESFVADIKVRTRIVPALLTNGDIEGQMTVYIDWRKIERHVVSRETRPLEIGGQPHPEMGEIEEVVAEPWDEESPGVEVIHDADFLVLPATSDTLDDALEAGGSVTIRRRWTEAKIKKMVDDGEFDEAEGNALVKAMQRRDMPGRANTAKELADAAGIKVGESGKFCEGYETWTKLKVDGEYRICRAYYGGEDRVLGCKLNPYWSDRLPIKSAPVEKIPGVFKGDSLIAPGVLDMQVAANDALNQGMDSLPYHMTGVTAVDPARVQRWQELVIDIAAVWPIPPGDIKQLEFPNLMPAAFDVIERCTQAIFVALSVNPAMLPQQTGKPGTKRNQAEIAMEQQVDLLTTADSVTNIEQEILTPMITAFAELDHQFRPEKMKLIRSYGELGYKAAMEEVPPIQLNRRWSLRWFGVEAARNAAQVQQMIAGLNVLRGIPPQQYPGYQLDVAPLLVHLVEQTYGPRLGPKIFKSLKEQLTMDPMLENQMLERGMEVMVHAQDDDPRHIQAHLQAPPGPQRDAHIGRHQAQMQQKQAAQAMVQQQGQPGAPGGGRQPGIAGTPRPGAQPAQPRQGFQPPGAIRPDAMPRAGALVMPRRT